MDILTQIIFIVALAALVIDICGALYLVKITRSSPAWVTEIVDKVQDGSIIDNLVEIEDLEGGKTQVMIDPRVGAIIDAIGSRIFQAASMSFKQGLGVDAKLDNKVKTAISNDMINKNAPWLKILDKYLGDGELMELLESDPGLLPNVIRWAAPMIPKDLMSKFAGGNNGPGLEPRRQSGNLGW